MKNMRNFPRYQKMQDQCLQVSFMGLFDFNMSYNTQPVHGTSICSVFALSNGSEFAGRLMMLFFLKARVNFQSQPPPPGCVIGREGGGWVGLLGWGVGGGGRFRSVSDLYTLREECQTKKAFKYVPRCFRCFSQFHKTTLVSIQKQQQIHPSNSSSCYLFVRNRNSLIFV